MHTFIVSTKTFKKSPQSWSRCPSKVHITVVLIGIATLSMCGTKQSTKTCGWPRRSVCPGVCHIAWMTQNIIANVPGLFSGDHKDNHRAGFGERSDRSGLGEVQEAVALGELEGVGLPEALPLGVELPVAEAEVVEVAVGDADGVEEDVGLVVRLGVEDGEGEAVGDTLGEGVKGKPFWLLHRSRKPATWYPTKLWFAVA